MWDLNWSSGDGVSHQRRRVVNDKADRSNICQKHIDTVGFGSDTATYRRSYDGHCSQAMRHSTMAAFLHQWLAAP